jgi:acyl-coenzyme A thioesterase PaaI-like protein
VTLGAAFEGGPGLVHGGILSLMFDHAMGTAVFVACHAAMTVSLEVRYRAPTPLETPLRVAAWVDRREGRKVFVGAEASVDGTVTATAEGVFLRLTRENVERIFPPDRIPAE